MSKLLEINHVNKKPTHIVTMNDALAEYLPTIGVPPSKLTPDFPTSKKWFSTKIGVEVLNSKGASPSRNGYIRGTRGLVCICR